jgi:hypothetical protein
MVETEADSPVVRLSGHDVDQLLRINPRRTVSPHL